MTTTVITGILGCMLAALHAALSLPILVRVANRIPGAPAVRLIHLWSGLAMYTCWEVYALISGNVLLGFMMALGMLKYGVVLIQLGISGFGRHKPLARV